MRYLYIAVIVVLVGLLLVFVFQNMETVTVRFFRSSLTMPRAILLLISFILGMFTGGALLALARSLLHGATRSAK